MSHQILLRAALSAMVLIALLYAIFLSSAVTGWLNPILFAIAALAYLIFNRASTGLELPAAAFLVVLWIAAAAGVDPRRSFEQLWGFTAGFLFIFFAASAARLLTPARLVALLLAAGALYMTWAWADATGWYARWLQAAPGRWLPELPFRLNGSNNTAAYLNLLLFTALGALISLRPFTTSSFQPLGGRSLFLSLYALSAAALVFLSNSRGGWVGTAAGAAAFLALVALQHGPGLRQAAARLLHSRRFWLAAAALLALVLALAWFYLSRMANHPSHGSRLDYWIVGLQAFLRSPLLGSGPNTYVIFHMQANSYPPTEAFLHSHNQYIDILAAAGLLGAAAFLAFLSALARRGLQTWRALDRVPGRFLFIGAAAALAAFLAHGVFDGLYRMPWAALTLAVLLGAFTERKNLLPFFGGIPPKKGLNFLPFLPELGGRGRGMEGFLLPFLALACAAAGLFDAWRTEPYLAGVQAASYVNLPAAADFFVEAARRDPAFAPIFTQLGLVQAQRADAGEPDLLASSAAAFEQAARLDPTWALNHAQLCAVQSALDRLPQAESACRRAVEAAPAAALFWFNLAAVQEKTAADSSAAYRQVLTLAPQTRTAPYWQTSPARRAALEAALAGDPSASNESPSVPDLEALAASGAARAADYLALAQAYRLAGRPADADSALQKSTLAYSTPADAPERLWQQAELATARGDASQATALRRQATDLILHPGLYGPQPGGQAAYISQAFFVPAFPADLVPQLAPLPLSAEWQQRLEGMGGG